MVVHLPRVLVVDDHLDTLQVFESALSLQGFSVTLAGNGCQALELASGARFDAVLTDLAMPGMDGHELIRELRALQGPRPLPIVVVSGQVAGYRGVHAGAGYCALIEKPCDLFALAGTLQRLISTCLHECGSCRHAKGLPPAMPVPAARA